jgi:hypothetical protein
VTQPLDPVDELLDAYFDYLEGVGEEPSLDHLSDEQRAEAEQLIASLKAAQGIDPEASRPSVAALLARAAARQETASAATLSATLQASLQHHVDPRAQVVVDVAAQAAGLDSVLVAHVRGLRIRVLVEGDGTDVDAAYAARVPAIAAVFGAFPDTNAALLTTVGDTPAGAIVDRDDIVTAIEAPSGRPRPPRISRPVMDPAEACVHYVSAVMPTFEPFEYVVSQRGATSADVFDVDQVVAAAVQEVVTSGARARLTAKKTAWTSIGTRETAGIADALRGALAGELDETAFREHVEELVEMA